MNGDDELSSMTGGDEDRSIGFCFLFCFVFFCAKTIDDLDAMAATMAAIQRQVAGSRNKKKVKKIQNRSISMGEPNRSIIGARSSQSDGE